jgi:hypothetical protein
MVAHPQIIERPIVVTKSAARLGRPPELVLEILYQFGRRRHFSETRENGNHERHEQHEKEE